MVRKLLRAVAIGFAISASLGLGAYVGMSRGTPGPDAGPLVSLGGRTDQGAAFRLHLDRDGKRIVSIESQLSAMCREGGSYGYEWTPSADRVPFRWDGEAFTASEKRTHTAADGTEVSLAMEVAGTLARARASGTASLDVTLRTADGRKRFCDTEVAWKAPLTRPLTSVPKGPVRLLMVPLDGIGEQELEPIVQAVARTYGVRAQITSRVRTPDSAYDPKRRQWDAEPLVRAFMSPHGLDPGAVMIGVTDRDLYSRTDPTAEYYWDYYFVSGYVVISTARLGDAADPAKRAERVRKLVTRHLGTLAFGLRPTGAPGSALAPLTMDVRALDRLGDRFCPGKGAMVQNC